MNSATPELSKVDLTPIFIETEKPSRWRAWFTKLVQTIRQWLLVPFIVTAVWCLVHFRFLWFEATLVAILSMLAFIAKHSFPMKGRLKWILRLSIGSVMVVGLAALLHPVCRQGFREVWAVQRLESAGAKVERWGRPQMEHGGWVQTAQKWFMPTLVFNAVDGVVFFEKNYHVEVSSSMLIPKYRGLLRDLNASGMKVIEDPQGQTPDLLTIQMMKAGQVDVQFSTRPSVFTQKMVDALLSSSTYQNIVFQSDIDPEVAQRVVAVRVAAMRGQGSVTLHDMGEDDAEGVAILSSLSANTILYFHNPNSESKKLGEAFGKIESVRRIHEVTLDRSVSVDFLRGLGVDPPTSLRFIGANDLGSSYFTQEVAREIASWNWNYGGLQIHRHVSDEAIAALRNSKIVSLYILEGASIREDGLSAILSMPNLETFELDGRH